MTDITPTPGPDAVRAAMEELDRVAEYLTVECSSLHTSAAMRRNVKALERHIAAQQAKIDALMLEHCPDEMSAEQVAEWGRHQRPASDETQAAIARALAEPVVQPAQQSADEIVRLRDLADSEGTRAVAYLRRARKAEAELSTLTPPPPAIPPAVQMAEVAAESRARFEHWMTHEAKVIVGSTDPYPRGLERDYWRVWQAAQLPAEPVFHLRSYGDVSAAQLEEYTRAAKPPAPAPAAVRDVEKRWPFVESPMEFTRRLGDALDHFELLGAVRYVLIENPPQLATLPPAVEAVAGVVGPGGPLEELKRALSAIRVVAAHAGKDCILRESVIDVVNQRLRAAGRARGVGEAPEGWKLVPVEPTPVMHNAAALAGLCGKPPSIIDGRIEWALADASAVYRAMLAAAPQPPKGQV